MSPDVAAPPAGPADPSVDPLAGGPVDPDSGSAADGFVGPAEGGLPAAAGWGSGGLAHGGRIVRSLLGNELIPAFVRTRLLRLLGARMDPTACIWAQCTLRSTDLDLGKHVFINIGFFFDGAARLTVEDNVRIGQFVRVITATHRIGPSRQRCRIEADIRPVRIGRGCWIGAGVTLMPGVTVAPGCVVAAGATVLASTEPDGLYAGVPARRIRDLPVGD